MTDRELLELAAKAAGLRVGFEPDGKERGRYDLYWSNVHHKLAWHGKSVGSEYPRPIFWNPIADNGDALELAVKLAILPTLAIDFRISNGATWWARQESEGVVYWSHEPHNGDPLAATRRAIVRAAAELGKAMK